MPKTGHFAPTPEISHNHVMAYPMPITYFRQAYQLFGKTPEHQREILFRTGLAPGAMLQHNRSITADAQIRQIENLLRLEGPGFPLRAPTVWQPASQGLLEFAFRSAPTIGDGIAHLCAYSHVRVPLIYIKEKNTVYGLSLRLTPSMILELPVWQALGEVVLLSWHAMIHMVTSPMVTNDSTILGEHVRISLPWDQPSHHEEIQHTLGLSPHYQTEEFSIEVSRTLLSVPSPFADQEQERNACAQLHALTERQHTTQPLSLTIKSIIGATYPHSPGADEVAKHVGLSRRTLVRRLAEEDTSYRQLTQDIKREHAHQLITQTQLSREDVAIRLGYSDGSSLNRMCRHWFGLSFRELRHRHD